MTQIFILDVKGIVQKKTPNPSGAMKKIILKGIKLQKLLTLENNLPINGMLFVLSMCVLRCFDDQTDFENTLSWQMKELDTGCLSDQLGG